MGALYTKGFVRAFDRLAAEAVSHGPDGRSPLILRLVVRVAEQAKLISAEDWRLELDAVCREFRTRMAGLHSPDGVCVQPGKRYREFYEHAVTRLEAAAGYDPTQNNSLPART